MSTLWLHSRWIGHWLFTTTGLGFVAICRWKVSCDPIIPFDDRHNECKKWVIHQRTTCQEVHVECHWTCHHYQMQTKARGSSLHTRLQLLQGPTVHQQRCRQWFLRLAPGNPYLGGRRCLSHWVPSQSTWLHDLSQSSGGTTVLFSWGTENRSGILYKNTCKTRYQRRRRHAGYAG